MNLEKLKFTGSKATAQLLARAKREGYTVSYPYGVGAGCIDVYDQNGGMPIGSYRRYSDVGIVCWLYVPEGKRVKK